MKEKLVSVIIPVYNAEEKLNSIIDCIKEQSYAELEVILVDDGSNDNTGSICDRIARKDSRFIVIHQENAGAAKARNVGMKSAKGEYIAFLDADDEIPENYLQVLTAAQKRTQADIVVCDVAMIQDGKESSRFTHEEAVLEQHQALNLLLSRRKINSGPCAKLFCKAILQETSFPPLRAYEDILFVKDAFVNANKIAVTNKTEYRYIQNESSAMHKFAKAPSKDIIIASEALINFLEKRNDLSSRCMYITVSHLFQYVQPLRKLRNSDSDIFVRETRKVYRRHLKSIVGCHSFPFKEKILFALFMFGIY